MNQKVQQQKKLDDEMQMIDDSLVALSKRVFQIEQFVLDELRSVRGGMDRSTKFLAEKQISRASAAQHQVMTNLNNLANMLVQSLTQMQESMQQQQNGKPQPRQGNRPGMQQLIQLQQQLNQQFQQGELTPGQQQELAKQQEDIRQKLNDMYQKLEGEGKGGLAKAMQEMEETEQELLKEELSKRTLERQQQIMNRMLDYDKAVREREFDEQRKSNSGKELAGQRPDTWDVETKDRALRQEQLQQGQFLYHQAYQQFIDDYYQRVVATPASR